MWRFTSTLVLLCWGACLVAGQYFEFPKWIGDTVFSIVLCWMAMDVYFQHRRAFDNSRWKRLALILIPAALIISIPVSHLVTRHRREGVLLTSPGVYPSPDHKYEVAVSIDDAGNVVYVGTERSSGKSVFRGNLGSAERGWAMSWGPSGVLWVCGEKEELIYSIVAPSGDCMPMQLRMHDVSEMMPGRFRKFFESGSVHVPRPLKSPTTTTTSFPPSRTDDHR
jgi:hypothetical protein